MRQSWLQRRWPAVRAQGRTRYVLMRGLLLWGGLMTLVLYAMLILSARRQGLDLQTVLPLVPVLCLPAGAFWGLVSWHWNEYLFRKLGFDTNNSDKGTSAR